MTWQFI